MGKLGYTLKLILGFVTEKVQNNMSSHLEIRP